jgi:hypothetical protein
MNMICETCGRDDVCVCHLPDDPREAGNQVLAALIAQTEGNIDGFPVHVVNHATGLEHVLCYDNLRDRIEACVVLNRYAHLVVSL